MTVLVSAQRIAASATSTAASHTRSRTPSRDPALRRTHPPQVAGELGDDAASPRAVYQGHHPQTGDLRRIVEEFSSSRGCRNRNAPRRTSSRWSATRSSCRTAPSTNPLIHHLPEGELRADLDATMIGQALTNLLRTRAKPSIPFMKRARRPGPRPNGEVPLTARDDSASSPSPTTASACRRTAPGSSSPM